MRKTVKKLSAAILAFVMVCTAFLGYLPSMSVQAATKSMAHLKSGSGNANGHFGGGKAEAFILSDKADNTDQALSAQVKFAGTITETRFRFVTKYVSDTQWAYIAYDNANGNGGHWFYEYKDGNASSYPDLSGLPKPNQNDIVNIRAEYVGDQMKVTVENVTTGETGTATTAAKLKDVQGKIGFGAGTYGTEYTDVYFSDVKAGTYAWTSYGAWTLYKDEVAGQVWEPAVEVGGEDPEQPQEPGKGRKWITIHSGANGGGGHAYGNVAAKAPALLLDNDKKMEAGGQISLTVKPENTNWGVFYSYVDDKNWLYVGYDDSSKWYYQYSLNGSGGYPQIAGLPAPVVGEEVQMNISLDRETLSVTVNGTTVRVTNQSLIQFSEATGGKGRFGVKVNGANESISFADCQYGTENCMEDNWVFAAKREGHVAEEQYATVKTVTGKVKSENGKALEKATVRLGIHSAVTDAEGNYQMDSVEVGDYKMAVSKAGYQAFEKDVKVTADGTNVFDVTMLEKEPLDLTKYDVIQSDVMKVYIGKEFPVVARYAMQGAEDTFFRGNETELNKVVINGKEIQPQVTVEKTTENSRVYKMHIEKEDLNFDMSVQISVDGNDLTWEVTEIKKAEGCAKIAVIDIPNLSLLSIDAAETGANFAGAKVSTTTTVSGDVFMDFENGFVPSDKDGYLYAFLQNGKLSAGLFSNSEVEGDKRVIRVNGADVMSLTSAKWYYEMGDGNGQKQASKYDPYPISELPCAKVAIAADENKDGEIDWNDGALAYRDIMNRAYGADKVKDMVNYRIVMNFASMAPNPYLATADNIKKVYLATDGLPQAVMLKGYGNEGHDSANSEYADIAEREGGVEDFQDLIKIAHDYNAEIGIHVNAQEIYPEAKSFNEKMIEGPKSYGWGWLDQSVGINKLWDLASQARWKRFVQLYDRINNTDHLSIKWPEAVKDSRGTVDKSKEELKKEAEQLEDNMDFIYLDVWYQNSWETRRVAEEINSLGWRFSTEFSAQGEYDSTWQHWSTDAGYGGASAKGFNSSIIRFIRNDQRDSQVLNHPAYGGTADNPLLGGYRLYGFEGWGGDRNYDNYIFQTFNQNLPTKFLQHYYVTDWENYEEGQSPVGNQEKEITLMNEKGDKVIVTRNEEQRKDTNIERKITLNGKTVLNDVTYLLPWTDNQDGTEKLYHWNLEGGTTTWELPDGWNVENVVMYELSDQGRINETSVAVNNGSVTLEAKEGTPYVVVKGAALKTLKHDFGEADYVVDPGFNGYADGTKLSSDEWSGDIANDAVVVEKAATGDQRLAFNSPKEDVAVTTTISGLKKGVNYVAEVNVENNSDAKAVISVNSGTKTVSNYTEKSILRNYVKCDTKNGTQMQRMQVSFTAEEKTAQLTLAREAGVGASYMDDIRIVEKTVDNFKADGSFEQDFETIVQGLYPFVLSSAQGISDPGTHLSQLNAPYTQAGWGDRVIDDVIDGEWSVKHHGSNRGIIYQTIPQNFRFERGKVYNVEFDYQSGPDKAYAMVVGDGANYTAPTQDDYLAQAHGSQETKHVSMQVVGSGSGQTWIGLYANKPSGNSKVGETDFILDNLKITEVKDAVAVTISKTTLYKGETAEIYGSGLDKITWKSSDESVVTVDQKAGTVNALAKGTATLTATVEDKTLAKFDITVEDQVVTEIPREEYKDISSSANTEETEGEDAGAVKATDGNSSTFWHSAYSGGKFNVSADHPAVLTVDLGKEMEIGGFKFQQRPSVNNGIVQQYSYRILDGSANVLASGKSIKTTSAEKMGGAWITVQTESVLKNAKTIEISVESGQGGFAVVAEVVPILMKKVADGATLENVTLKVGEKKVLEPVPVNGTMLTGLVWASSDEKIVTVTQNGTVQAWKEGTATISVSNVAGLKASCTVTVEAAAGMETDKTDLRALIAYAESQKESNEYSDVLPVVKAAFEKSLEEAKTVEADEKATQAEINAVYEALLANVHLLGFVGNTDDLELALELAKGTNTEGKTEASVKVLNDAIAKAEEIIANGNVLQEDIDAAREALLAAINGLEDQKTVDKAALKKLIDQSEKYMETIDQYTPATANAFKTAMEAAKAVYADAKATQEQVDAAYQALQQAVFGLRLIPDKGKLEELLQKADCLEVSKYTEETVIEVVKAATYAETVYANENATEKEVKKAEKMLQAAMDGLKEKTDVLKVPDKNENKGSDHQNSQKKSAKTGDASAIVFFMMLLLASSVMIVKRKREVSR